MSPQRSRLRPALVAGALALTTALTTALGATPAQAAPTESARSGSAWLAGQLTDGVVYNEQYDFEDYGLTIDVGLALAEVGGQAATVQEIRTALALHVTEYTSFDGDVFANAVAKTTRWAQVAGANPRSYGGVDLVKQLNRRITASGSAAGRLADKSSGTDFASTIGQAFAVGALHRADSRMAAKATRFLVAQQCPAGWCRNSVTERTRGPQSCQDAPADQKGASTDATALAVLELRTLPRADRTQATRKAVDKALAWLQRTQRADGSFGSDSFIPAPNTNSTGLAGWALGVNDRCGLARKAARWVRDLQVPADATGPLAEEVGAIAYDQAGYDAGETDGIVVETRDQWRRASAQAAPALLFDAGC